MDIEELRRVRSYRYVLYARKSTSDEHGEQFRSIPDQVKACEEMAERLGLNVVKIIKEDKSAKISEYSSGQRHKFYEMVQDIEAGKYDGILSYHPDRLSRNTFDSGKLVDMLDTGKMVDLKFPTTEFRNNASGKLMLNIMFAMAKEYSEKLSENVRRGMHGNFEEGKANGSNKWGYDIDEASGQYKPNESFEAIQRGFMMLAEGNTNQAEVIDMWLREGVSRKTKGDVRKGKRPKTIKISKQIASKLFTDTFYYGLLRSKQNGTQTDLREAYNGRFQPMITEDAYNAIQAIGVTRARTTKKKKRSAPFSPFQQFIFCSVCNNKVNYMVVGASGRVGQKKLYMRCDNKACEAYGKSIRAHVLLDDLTEKLEKMKFTAKDYEKAKRYFAKFGDEKRSELQSKRDSASGALKHDEKLHKQQSMDLLGLPKDTPESSRRVIINEVQEQVDKIKDHKAEIAKIDRKLELTGEFAFTVDEFLNIANVAADKMRAGDPVEKDAIARLLLLNIEMGYKKAPSYRWKEPFATLVNQPVVNSGAAKRT
jgi:site-specific DNA recombinase